MKIFIYIAMLVILVIFDGWLWQNDIKVVIEYSNYIFETTLLFLFLLILIVLFLTILITKYCILLKLLIIRGKKGSVEHIRNQMMKMYSCLLSGDFSESEKIISGVKSGEPYSDILGFWSLRILLRQGGDIEKVKQYFNGNWTFCELRLLFTDLMGVSCYNNNFRFQVLEHVVRTLKNIDDVPFFTVEYLIAKKEWNNAVKYLRNMINMEKYAFYTPDRLYVVCSCMIADGYRMTGKYRKALDIVESICDKYPLMSALLIKAEIHHEIGNSALSIKTLKDMYVKFPHVDVIDVYIGVAGNSVQALQEIVNINPDCYYGYVALAEAMIKDGQYQSARKCVDSALEVHTQFSLFDIALRIACIMKDFQYVEKLRTMVHTLVRDPYWICGDCGASYRRWQFFCQKCSAFDSMCLCCNSSKDADVNDRDTAK